MAAIKRNNRVAAKRSRGKGKGRVASKSSSSGKKMVRPMLQWQLYPI